VANPLYLVLISILHTKVQASNKEDTEFLQDFLSFHPKKRRERCRN